MQRCWERHLGCNTCSQALLFPLWAPGMGRCGKAMMWSRASRTSCDPPFPEPWHSCQPSISLPMSGLRAGAQISRSQHCCCLRYWLWPSCGCSRLMLMDTAVQGKSWDCEAETELCSPGGGCSEAWAIGSFSSGMRTEGCAEMSAHCSSRFPRE